MAQLEHIEAIEHRLWGAADQLRANSNYASNEYFLPVMGLVFLRHAYSRYLVVLATIGIFNGGNSIVQTRYMFSIVQQDHQADYITVATVLGMVSIGLAGLTGGALLTWFGDFEIHQGALYLNAYHLIFICSALLFDLPHAIRTRLRQGKEVPSAKMIAFITRSLRTMLGSMAALVPPLDDIESHDSQDTTDGRRESPVQS